MKTYRSLAGAAVMLCGLGASHAGAQPEWFSLCPGSRTAAGMAFDSARAVAVMFGGTLDGQTFSGETWERSNGHWSQRHIPGPSARSGITTGMVYDSNRGVVVLFGGGPPSSFLNDTWEYNGAAWVQRSVPGPSGRRYHAMAYDPHRGVTVLFGGKTVSSKLGDTWEWNGQSWLWRDVQGPPARAESAMAYDRDRRVMVLFSGDTGLGPQFPGDTWEWNGAVWTQRAVGGPAARWGHSLVYDPVRRVAVLNGGWSDYLFYAHNDTWEWDGAAWTEAAGPRTSRTSHHATAIEPSTGSVVRYGGHVTSSADTTTDLLWERRSGTWIQPETLYPRTPSRSHAAAAYDSHRDVTVLFGGEWSFSNQVFGDTWELNGNRWTERTPASGAPPARSWHAMAYDAARQRTVLFGGYGAQPQMTLGDTWEWDGVAWVQRASGPAKAGHAMAYDSHRGVVVLFGGNPLGGQTWEWDGESWTLRPVIGPPPRSRTALAFDSQRRRTVMFGGSWGGGAASVYDDTWEWDGDTWLRREAPGPSARRDHAMAYDPARGCTVLYGRPGQLGTEACWEWDGVAWTQRTTPGPGPRSAQVAVYDSGRGAVAIIGAQARAYPESGDGPKYGETWFLGDRGCVPIFAAPPAPVAAAIGSEAVFTAAANGAFAYRWRYRGLPLEDGPRHAGCATPTLRISGVSMADRGDYSLSISNSCGTRTSDPVMLVVTGCYGNCDGSQADPVLNVADFVCFLSRYAGGDPWANCDGSTTPPVLNAADFQCFQSRFAEGCP